MIVAFQEQTLEVKCTLINGDKRFGFSVIGGREEGFQPCIDEITPGNQNILICASFFLFYSLWLIINAD